MSREKLKRRIINEMVRGSDEADREEMLLELIREYPNLNTPKDRKKFRELYTKFKLEEKEC
jgi:hypothetical protein